MDHQGRKVHSDSARTGKTNPPEQWIWSEEPAHEALVSREMFEEGARRSVARDNVVKAARARPDYAPRTYLLRSFLRCGVCGLRMHGRRRHGVAYYACETARRQATLVAPRAPEDGPRQGRTASQSR
jgi:hypothetical protein